MIDLLPDGATTNVTSARTGVATCRGAVRTPGWRWCVALTLVGVLVALPGAVGAWPAQKPSGSAATLLDRVRISDQVAWSGYGETRGDLVLPDVAALEDLPETVIGSTRLRVVARAGAVPGRRAVSARIAPPAAPEPQDQVFRTCSAPTPHACLDRTPPGAEPWIVHSCSV